MASPDNAQQTVYATVEDCEAEIQRYTDAIKKDPDDVTNYINRSSAHLKLANFEECICDADKALSIDSENVAALTNKGVALYELNKLDEALGILDSAKRKAGEDTENTNLLEWHEKCSIAVEKKQAGQPFTPAPPKPSIKYDWYQTDSNVVITILIKKLPADHFNHSVTDFTLDMELLIPGENVTWKQHLDLAHEINSSKTVVKVLSTKVEIKLYKREGIRWNALEMGSELDKLKTFSSAGAAPTALGSNKWDKLAVQVAEEEKSENLEGDAALQKLFKDIYMNGSEETRRAMNKSFQQSGGTVLSTNWSDIGKKDVEVKPPDGMEYKKWE